MRQNETNLQREFSVCMLKQKRSPSTISKTINMIIDSGMDHQMVSALLHEATKNCKTDEEFLAAVRAVLGEED